MNIFSNLGITELVLIFLLALLVVGPERLPELGRKLGATLRDLRKAYENLTRDLGPELASFQETARELRDSVDSVRTIPQDMVQKVVKSAELDETLDELKGVRDTVGGMGKTLTDAQKAVSNPLNAAVATARSALSPEKAQTEKGPGDERTIATRPAEEPGDAAGMAQKAAAGAEQQNASRPDAGTATSVEEEPIPANTGAGSETVAAAKVTADPTALAEQQEQDSLEVDTTVPPEQDDD